MIKLSFLCLLMIGNFGTALGSPDEHNSLRSHNHGIKLAAPTPAGTPPPGGPPAASPTVSAPTTPSPTVTTNEIYDYSCVHSNAWLINTDGDTNSYVSAFTDIYSSVYSSREWTVGFNAIPKYDHTMTDSDILTLNSRPLASSDFTTGQTTATSGQLVTFGDDIGYDSTACTQGYWPPGPECPAASGTSLTFTLTPAPETGTGCWTGPTGLSGTAVNGAALYTWGDGFTYNDDGVWSQIAAKFEKYDMDFCMGHAANGNYHHHTYSMCLGERLGDEGTGHSPVYGFANDGYPIYGPYQSNGVLAVSCWTERDYSSSSATGCSDSQRSCLLVDQLDYTQGTVTASSAGPDTDATVTSVSGNSFTAVSGMYFEDYYYDASCSTQGDEYLDEHNGHSHGDYGYHYHMTINSIGEGTFPYYVGPVFYGCLTMEDSWYSTCYSSQYGTSESTSTCGTSDATSTAACQDAYTTSAASATFRINLPASMAMIVAVSAVLITQQRA